MVDPLPDEVTQVNNTATFVLRVVDQPIGLLLLEGKPYWDGKFLMRTLAFDPAIELHSVIRLTDQRLMERTLRRANAELTADEAGDANAARDSSQSSAPDGGIVRIEDWRIISDAADVLSAKGLRIRDEVGMDSLRQNDVCRRQARSLIRSWSAPRSSSRVRLVWMGQPPSFLGGT